MDLKSVLCFLLMSYSELVISQYRGLYVNDFDRLVVDKKEMEHLIAWSKQHDITSLSLYDLHQIFLDSTKVKALHTTLDLFHSRGLKTTAVFGGTETFENYFNDFQNEHSIGFDAINLEYEWWVGRDHFELFEKEAAVFNASYYPFETYIGWLSKGKKKRAEQAEKLCQMSDIITIHAYQKEPSPSYLCDRLRVLDRAAEKLKKRVPIVIIYSMETRFSGPLSKKKSYDQMHDQLLSELDVSEFPNLEFIGWKVFCYTDAIKYRPLVKSDK